jgi:hypothetical protein
MSKKLVPRDKGRVSQAAKRPAKAPVKTQPGSARRSNPGPANRARNAKAAPQKGGIAGFFQRLFGRFRRA